MTRIFVDTRPYRGCWVAAHAAGLCDLDAVALVAEGASCGKAPAQMRKALRRASQTSRLSVVEIPCRTVDAIGTVAELARPGDVIVSDSAPLADEFLKAGGEATNSFGERYTQENTPLKVRHFYACQELKSLGVNPYKRRKYKTSDCERLLGTLVEIIGDACGAAPKDTPASFRPPSPQKAFARPLPPVEFEKGPHTRVFVDGDACPRLPAILEICGGARTPVVFVSNAEVGNLVDAVCKKEPALMLGVRPLPDMTVEKVPVERNAADRFIERHIAPGDVVLTDDNALTVRCVNKGALAIDYRGRAFALPPGCGRIAKNDVKRMKAASTMGRKKKLRDNAFRSSLSRAIG